jgi:hypothetical protein
MRSLRSFRSGTPRRRRPLAGELYGAVSGQLDGDDLVRLVVELDGTIKDAR